MNKKHEKMWQEYIDGELEMNVKKKKGQYGCSIFIVGSNHHLMMALASLFDKLLRAKVMKPSDLQHLVDTAVKHAGDSK